MANSPTTTEPNNAQPEASTAGAVGYLKDNPNILPQNTALHAAFAKMIASNPALATMSHNDILSAVENFHENMLLQLEGGEDIQHAVAGAARNFLEDHPLVKDQIDIGTLLLLKESAQGYYEQTTYVDTNKHLRYDPYEAQMRREQAEARAMEIAEELKASGVSSVSPAELDEIVRIAGAENININPEILREALAKNEITEDPYKQTQTMDDTIQIAAAATMNMGSGAG